MQTMVEGTEQDTNGPSTSSPVGQEPASQERIAAGPDRGTVVFMAFVMGAHLPFVLFYCCDLLRFRPYYNFFPLFLAVIAWLFWKRWPRKQPSGAVLTGNWGQLLLLLGLGCLGGSILLSSPSLGATAAVLSLGGLIVGLQGRAAIRELSSVWLLLWLIIPPTVLLADQLVHLLHRLTARIGSWILETILVDHALAASVFRLPQRELFVAEACSGINSQLALIALACCWRSSCVGRRCTVCCW